MSDLRADLPVVVIGAGPVGLAAAAHLAAKRKGFLLLEAGTSVPPHGADELRHPEPGLFVVGMKSYGRAPTFLMLTGYEQVRSVVADLTGDLPGARRVELTLPATGVCSATPSSSEDAAACCASTPTPTLVGGLGRKAAR